MNCKFHREVEAKYICDKCKQPICEDCAIDVRGNKVCTSCIDYAVYAEKDYVKRISFWNKFAFFILACIPGAAHMQMGLFKRGTQLMLTFIGSFILLSYAYLDSFIPLIIIPTWFFSFFDAYSIRKKSNAGQEVEDAEVYNYQFILQNKKLAAIALVVIGAMGILNLLFSIDFSYINIRFNEYFWVFRRSMFPLLLGLSGVILLVKLKKNEGKEKQINIEE